MFVSEPCFHLQSSSISQSTPRNDPFGRGSSRSFICLSSFRPNIKIENSILNLSFGGNQGNMNTIEVGSGGGDGGGGRLPPSGGGGGGGGGDDCWDFFKREDYGLYQRLAAARMWEEAARVEAARAEAAKARKLMGLGLMWPVGFLMASSWMLGSPILADPYSLFKSVTEVVTGCCSSAFAELQKKGKEFWSKLFAVDILFGVAVDVTLGKLLAANSRMGLRPSASGGFLAHLQSAFAFLPSSFFEGGSSGFNCSLEQQVATFFYKGILFAAVGLGCGITCHAILNMIMTGNRNTNKSEEGIPVSYMVKNAALWGVLLPLSSNSRSQIVKRLEELVRASPLAKRVPLTALAFAVGMRCASNVYGGVLFAFWAKWSGIFKDGKP